MSNVINEGFIKNNKCFVRKDHDCGKYFGVSKTCFIACPDSDEIKLELEIIQDRLRREGIDPYIAAQERVYGSDIFCTKICGKIIESMFCMVILNEVSKSEEPPMPNPNVHYEYGMMTSMNKEIIPLLKKGQSPAFNIQSFDTIQYTAGDFPADIAGAIKRTIAIIANQNSHALKSREQDSISRNIAWLLEIIGLDKTHKFIEEDWRDICRDTEFNVYLKNSTDVFLAGVFDSINIESVNGNIKIVLKRLENLWQQYQIQIENLKKEKEKVATKEVSSFISIPLYGFNTDTPESIEAKINITKWNMTAFGKITFLLVSSEILFDEEELKKVADGCSISFAKPRLEFLGKEKTLALLGEQGLIKK